jgi:DNA mismatch repair protein MutL
MPVAMPLPLPADRPAHTMGPADRDADPWGLQTKRSSSPPPAFGAMPVAAPVAAGTLPSAGYVQQAGTQTQSVGAADLAAAETTLVSPSTAQLLQLNIAREAAAPEPVRPAVSYSSLRFLAQVRGTYLVCEGAEALYVIDQHAAAERVNFARLKNEFSRHEVARQQLLVAEVVSVSSAEAVLVDEVREQMLAFGVDARMIGDGRVAVQAVPAMMSKAPPATLLRDLLDELARTGDRRFSDATDLVLATMACHGSVRAGDPMHPDECAALLRALDEVDFAGYCPHGRPIVTTLTFVELEKKVGRR